MREDKDAAHGSTGGRHLETSILDLVRQKERELREIIVAARQLAEEQVEEARREAERLVTGAKVEAESQADLYLQGELAKVESEAREIVARSGTEVDAVHRLGAQRRSMAVDLVISSTVPQPSGEEGR